MTSPWASPTTAVRRCRSTAEGTSSSASGRTGRARAAGAAASITWTALQRGWQVTLLWCGADGPATVRGDWEQLWDALARLRADGPPLSQALGRLAAHLRETVPVVVSSRPGSLRLPVVLVAPAGSATAWEYARDGAVRCAAS